MRFPERFRRADYFFRITANRKAANAQEKDRSYPASEGRALALSEPRVHQPTDGTVDGEKLLKIVRETPGAFFLIISNQVLKQVEPPQFDVDGIIEGITTLLMLSAHGDEKSGHQIRAIEKLISPSKYELPFTKIREIVDRYETSPPLARGWELRRIMNLRVINLITENQFNCILIRVHGVR